MRRERAASGRAFTGAPGDGRTDPREVGVALHQLSRKELVRPARASSMAGELEHGFWYLLVRDVCYGQIPRAARADKHQAVAAWIERRAGERRKTWPM
jgi:hypothetical protein